MSPKEIIIAPKTYYEWMELLNRLEKGNDDQEILSAMKSGSLSWQTGVAERFVTNLGKVINHRLNAAIDRFQEEMRRSLGTERQLVNALLQLRRELIFLQNVVSIPAIPEDQRKKCVELVRDQADSIQKQLEKSAKTDRSGRLLCTIQNNRVNRLEEL